MWCCAFSRDGRRVVSTSNESVVRLWDAGNGNLIETLAGHSAAISACGFAADGAQIVAAAVDQAVKRWDGKDGHELPADLAWDRAAGLPAGMVSRRWPDQWALVSPERSGRLQVIGNRGRTEWDLAGGGEGLTACAVSPDGRTLVTGAADGALFLWEGDHPPRQLPGHRGRVNACVFSPDGKQVVSVAGDATLRCAPLAGKRNELVFQGHQGAVTGCALSPDGSRIASVSDDLSLRVWDARNGNQLHVLQGHSGRITSCAFSPSGQSLVSASEDGVLKLWDVATGADLSEYPAVSGMPLALDWNPRAGIVIATSSGAIELLALEHPGDGPAIVPTWHQWDDKIHFDCPVCLTGCTVRVARDGTLACPKCRSALKLNPFAVESERALEKALTRAAKDKPKAFKEFAAQSGAETHSDRALVVAAWLYQAENNRSVWPDDVAAYFRRAGWSFKLANRRVPFRELASRGLGSWHHGRFTISEAGLALVREMTR